MRKELDKHMKNLHTDLLEMSVLINQALINTRAAMVTQNTDMANTVAKNDYIINQKESQIEQLCLFILLTQQPVAQDLRTVSAVLKMITDMERIGDQAQDIAQLIPHLAGNPCPVCASYLKTMFDKAIEMTDQSIKAYVAKDYDLAKAIIISDEIVDSLFVDAKNCLVEKNQTDELTSDQGLHLLMVAKYLERIADHAVNLAEWVTYMVSGKKLRADEVSQ